MQVGVHSSSEPSSPRPPKHHWGVDSASAATVVESCRKSGGEGGESGGEWSGEMEDSEGGRPSPTADEEAREGAGERGAMPRSSRKEAGSGESRYDHHWGVPLSYKWWVILFVLTPKLLLALASGKPIPEGWPHVEDDGASIEDFERSYLEEKKNSM